MHLKKIEEELGKLAQLDAKQNVLIQATKEAKYGQVLDALGLCQQQGLTRVSITMSQGY